MFHYKQKRIMKAIEAQYDFKSFDFLHAHTLFSDGGIAYKLNRRYGISYIVSVRSTDFFILKYRPYLKGYMRKILLNASKVIFLSDKTKTVLYKKSGTETAKIIQEKCAIIPNGIDDFWIENRSLHEKSKEAIRVICVGRIDKNKNAIAVCKALQLLAAEGKRVCFRLIGNCGDPALLKELTSFDFVRHEAFMTKEELIKEYQRSDIYVMPSHYETFGLVYAEAMSQGLPVIYSEGQGFDGQFEEGIVGFHVRSTDLLQIKEAIMRAYDSYETISPMCVEKSQIYTWKRVTEIYSDLYRTIPL